jgi:L,D-peptidoglycan transpeptidase YkuD (ErfK/YbiS/YcfS/YnhG family)
VEGLRGILFRQLFVRVLSRRATTGTLIFGHLRLPCALGRGGCKPLKREGDGATPLGRFPLRQAYFRPDRLARPRTGLPLRPIRADDGWCDAPGDRNYNRLVRRPYPASAERMWRADQLYDIVVVLGYNDRPRVQGRGSAIFLHVARGALEPTEGCIAVRRADFRKLLPLLGPGTVLRVGA